MLIGAGAERALGAAIRAEAPEAIDLIGRTELPDLGPIAARAALAVGNDTGPMHLIAALGRPVLVLFSSESDPALTAPQGPEGAPVSVLTSRTLADLPLERVVAALPSPHRREPDPEQLSPCPKSASPTDPSEASTHR